MLEGVLESVFLKYLSEYVVDFNKSQLQVAVWQGDVVLHNLILKKSALDGLELPVNVTFGHLDTLTLQVPWSSLGSSPVKVTLDGLHIICEPQFGLLTAEIADDDTRRLEIAQKRERLKRAASLQSEQCVGQDQARQSFFDRLVAKVAANVQFMLLNVHIRYEDRSIPRHTFACAITIEELGAHTTNADGEIGYVSPGDLIHKIFFLKSLCIYWDSKADAWTYLSVTEAKEKLSHIATDKKALPCHNYVLLPLSATVKAVISNVYRENTPKYIFEVSLSMTEVSLGKTQYDDLIRVLNQFASGKRKFEMARHFRMLRPSQNAKICPREWWVYASRCILRMTCRTKKSPWISLTVTRQQREQYTNLYQRSIMEGHPLFTPLSDTDKEDLQRLEDVIDLEVILMYRSIASLELKLAGAEAVPKDNSWFSFLWKSDPSHDEPVQLTAQQKQDLFRTIDFDKDISHLLAPPPDYIVLDLTVIASDLSFSLHSSSGTPITTALFQQSSLHFRRLTSSSVFSAYVDKLSVVDTCTATAFPKVVTCLTDYMHTQSHNSHLDTSQHAFFFTFETNPVNSILDSILVLSVAPIVWVFNPNWVHALDDFFMLNSYSDDLQALAVGWKELKQQEMLNALTDRATCGISIDVLRPILLIPSDPGDASTALLVADMKDMSLRSHHESVLPDQLIMPVNPKKYDLFSCSLSSIRLCLVASLAAYDAFVTDYLPAKSVSESGSTNLVDPNGTCEDATNVDEQLFAAIIEQFSLHFYLHALVAAEDKDKKLCKFTFSACLPLLFVHLTSQTIQSLARLVANVTKIPREKMRVERLNKAQELLDIKHDRRKTEFAEKKHYSILEDIKHNRRRTDFVSSGKPPVPFPMASPTISPSLTPLDSLRDTMSLIKAPRNLLECAFFIGRFGIVLYSCKKQVATGYVSTVPSKLVSIIASGFYGEFVINSLSRFGTISLRELTIEDHCHSTFNPFILTSGGMGEGSLNAKSDTSRSADTSRFQACRVTFSSELSFEKLRESYLLMLHFNSTPRSSPLYLGVDHNIEVVCSSVSLYWNPETVLSLVSWYDFCLAPIRQGFVENSDDVQTVDDDQRNQDKRETIISAFVKGKKTIHKCVSFKEATQQVLHGNGQSILRKPQNFVLKFTATLQQISVILQKQSHPLVRLTVNDLLLIADSLGTSVAISGRLGSLKVCQLDTTACEPTVLFDMISSTTASSTTTSSLLTFKVTTTDPTSSSSIGYDVLVRVRLRHIKAVYMQERVLELVDYLQEGFLGVLLKRTASSVAGSKFNKLDVCLDSWVLIVPRHESHLSEYLRIELGRIFISNANSVICLSDYDSEGGLANTLNIAHQSRNQSHSNELLDCSDFVCVETITVKATSMRVTTHRGGVPIVPNIHYTVSILRPLDPLPQLDEVEVNAHISRVFINLSRQQFLLIFGVILGNIAPELHMDDFLDNDQEDTLIAYKYNDPAVLPVALRLHLHLDCLVLRSKRDEIMRGDEHSSCMDASKDDGDEHSSCMDASKDDGDERKDAILALCSLQDVDFVFSQNKLRQRLARLSVVDVALVDCRNSDAPFSRILTPLQESDIPFVSVHWSMVQHNVRKESNRHPHKSSSLFSDEHVLQIDIGTPCIYIVPSFFAELSQFFDTSVVRQSARCFHTSIVDQVVIEDVNEDVAAGLATDPKLTSATVTISLSEAKLVIPQNINSLDSNAVVLSASFVLSHSLTTDLSPHTTTAYSIKARELQSFICKAIDPTPKVTSILAPCQFDATYEFEKKTADVTLIQFNAAFINSIELRFSYQDMRFIAMVVEEIKRQLQPPPAPLDMPEEDELLEDSICGKYCKQDIRSFEEVWCCVSCSTTNKGVYLEKCSFCGQQRSESGHLNREDSFSSFFWPSFGTLRSTGPLKHRKINRTLLRRPNLLATFHQTVNIILPGLHLIVIDDCRGSIVPLVTLRLEELLVVGVTKNTEPPQSDDAQHSNVVGSRRHVLTRANTARNVSDCIDNRYSTLSLSCIFHADHYNASITVWEPLLESCQFSAQAKQYQYAKLGKHVAKKHTSALIQLRPEERNSEGYLLSTSGICVNVTFSLLQTLCSTLKVWQEDYNRQGTEISEDRALYSPLFLKNDTGLPLSYWSKNEGQRHKQVPSGGQVLIDVDSSSFDVQKEAPRYSLSIHLPSYEPLQGLVVGKDGRFVYPLTHSSSNGAATAQTNLVMGCDSYKGSKLVTIKSTFQLFNATDLPIEVLVYHGLTKRRMESHQSQFDAIMSDTHKPKQHHVTFADEPIEDIADHPVNAHIDGERTIFGPIACNATMSLPADLTDWSSLLIKPISPIQDQITENYQWSQEFVSPEMLRQQHFPLEGFESDEPCVKLILRCPVVFHNLLPFSVGFELFYFNRITNEQEAQGRSTIESGKEKCFSCIKLSRCPAFTLLIPGFCKTSLILIMPKSGDGCRYIPIIEPSGVHSSILLTIENTLIASGQRHIIAYTHFWIIDRSGLDTVFAWADKKSKKRNLLPAQIHPVFEEVYENSRFFSRWRSPCLPTDRPKWSSASGAASSRNIELDSSLWSWEEDWHVEKLPENDKEGWEYASDFPGPYHPTHFPGCLVRRRKWIRKRVCVGDRVPLLLVDTGDESCNLHVKVGVGPWSKAFGISEGSNDGVVSCLQRKGLSCTKRYELSVQFQMGAGQFYRTKMVTFRPHYVLVNNLNQKLIVIQTEGSTVTSVNTKDFAPYFLENFKLSRNIRIGFEKWNLSGSFPISEVGEFSIQFSNDIGHCCCCRVNITQDTCTYIVINREDVASPSYRVENMLSIPIAFAQKTMNALGSQIKWQDLAPGLSTIYSWEELGITRPLLLTVNIVGHEANIPLDKLDTFSELSLESTHNMPDMSYRVGSHESQQALFYDNHHDPMSQCETRTPLVKSKKPPFQKVYFCVYSDGLTKVLRVYTGHIPKPVEGILQHKSSHVVSLKLDIPQFEISVFDKLRRELMLVTAKYTFLELTFLKRSIKAHFQVQALQLDNQILDTPFPVVLSPRTAKKESHSSDNRPPFLQITFTKQLYTSNVTFFKFFAVYISPCDLQLDETFLRATSNFFYDLFLKSTDEVLPVLDDVLLYLSIKDPNSKLLLDVPDRLYMHSTLSPLIYFDLLELYPIRLHFSFALTNSSPQSSADPLQTMLKTFGIMVANVDKASLTLEGLRLSEPCGTRQHILSRLLSHYKSQALKQIYVIFFGHLKLLGDPINLLNSLGTGVKHFFSEPADGLLQGPGGLSLGVAKGTLSLLTHTVSGFAGAASGIAENVGHGMASLSGDRQYMRRREAQARSTPKDAVDGLLDGSRQVIVGVGDGLSGMLTKPMKGARSGIGGFFKGLTKGLLGAVVKPVTGVVDGMSKVTQGIQSSSMMFESKTSQKQRCRPPRVISGARADKILRRSSRRKRRLTVSDPGAPSFSFFCSGAGFLSSTMEGHAILVSSVDALSHLSLEHAGDGFYSICTLDGRFFSVGPDAQHTLTSNALQLSTWEKFQLRIGHNNQVHLLGWVDKYVRVFDGKLRCDVEYSDSDKSQCFFLNLLSGHVYLLGSCGLFVHADGNNVSGITTKVINARWSIVCHECNNSFALKTRSGLFLGVDSDGQVLMVSKANYEQATVQFIISPLNGKFALLTVSSLTQYLCLPSSGSITTNKAISSDCLFEFS